MRRLLGAASPRRVTRTAVGAGAGCWFLLAAVATAQAPSAGTRPLVLAGRVRDDAGHAVAYARVVATTSDARDSVVGERLTDAGGAFTFTTPGRGTYRLVARQIGFRPDTQAVAVAGAAADSVRLTLRHAAVTLAGVRVIASPTACTAPGLPGEAADPGFRAAVDALFENAARVRLLTDQLHFQRWDVRDREWVAADGGVRHRQVDTLPDPTGVPDRYEVGQVLAPKRDASGRLTSYHLVVATPYSVGAGSFIAAHCFTDGGVDTADGVSVRRIDFAPAAAIRTPDLSGSFYLDAATGLLRRSVVRVTGAPPPGVPRTDVTVTSAFREVLPGLVAEDGAVLTQFFGDRGRNGGRDPDGRRVERLVERTKLYTSRWDPPAAGAAARPGDR